MAAPRKTIVPAPLTPEQQAELDAEIERAELDALEVESDREFTFEDELRELSNGKIRVSRVSSSTRGAPGGYCFTCDAADYSLDQLMDRIRDEYGGGKYRLRVYGQGGLKMNREIEVIESVRKISDQASAPAVQAQNSGDRLTEILVMMQENQRIQSEQSQMQMRQQQEMMLKQSEQNQAMLLGIIQSMNNRPAQEGMSIGDALALAKTLAPPAVDPMEKFLQGVQFGKEMGAAEADKSPLQSLAENALGPLLELGKMASIANQPPMPPVRAPQPQVRPALPVAQPAPVTGTEQIDQPEPAAIAAAEPMEQNDMNLAALAQWQPILNMCYQAAQIDADPETYANLILDQVGPEMATQLLADPANYEKLMTMVPALTPYRQWFDDLKNVVLELLRQETDDEGDGVDGVSGQSGSANLSGEQLPGAAPHADESDA